MSPSARGGDCTTWNGPVTVDSVEPPAGRWLMVSTSMDTPSTSESRMNSCRTSSHLWPVCVRKAMPRSHSSPVSPTSLTKACRWVTSEVSTSRRRGGAAAKLAATTCAERSSVNSSESMAAPW